tara:strand:- start:5752 stop:6288 length:537 start_codon:yes stop_codon:yes gene_type:complete
VSKNKVRKKLLILRKKNYKPIVVNFRLLEKILKKNNFSKNKKIGAYYPINFEINCLESLKKIRNIISLPIIGKNNQMDFFEWSFLEPLKIGKFGIPEPNKLKKIYPDILFVPMVGFDKHKYRIGYGGGYYDRYINKLLKIKKILTVGLAFSFQEVKKLPINNYDKKLDYILTEKNLIE